MRTRNVTPRAGSAPLYTMLGAIAFILILLAAIGFVMVKVETIEGNEIGVLETWDKGVVEEPLPAKTYVFFPGFSNTVYRYPLSVQAFVMNDRAANVEFAEGRDSDAYQLQSKDSQDMWISLNTRWRIDPSKVVQLHRTVRDNVEERVLRPAVMRVVKDSATVRTALEVYSGEGLVALQQEIENKLRSNDDLEASGVIIEQFVVESIRLDPKYTAEISARQVAVQARLRAEEETRAAVAQAEKVRAEAQADLNRAVVSAQRDKEVGILNAQRDAERQVLAARAQAEQVTIAAGAAAQQVTIASEAEKNRNVLQAQGEQQAALLRAQAIEALGKADAERQRLQFAAYENPGAQIYARIEAAKAVATAFQNVKGYLPSDLRVNLLTGDFQKAVGVLMGEPAAEAPAAAAGR